MKLLKKIIFKTNKTAQIYLSIFGAFVGVIALLFSVLLLNDIESFQKNDKDLFGENSLIIQKKVTKFTTLGLNSTSFTDEEIQALKQKRFINNVAPFVSANYSVGISEYPGDGLPHFYADMFFQAIPNQFIDVETDWNWKNEKDVVPIILPRDFLMLINYGIAESQDMPQISEDLLKVARLKIHMKGKNSRGEITGKVVGFSHKISSILVPQSFLDFSNKKYGNTSKKSPQRLFLTIKDGSYGELQVLMDNLNLDINQSAIDITKIKSYVSVVIFVFLVAGVLIILLSILGFIQYVQLILNKTKTEIDILFKQGYQFKVLLKVFVNYFTFIFGSLTISAIILVLIIKKLFLNPILINNGINVASNEIVVCIMVGFISFIMFLIANYLTIKTTLKKIGTN